MVGTVFDLKPCHSRAARVDRSSQLIWVEPNVFMCLIKSNVVLCICLTHVLCSTHEKFDVWSKLKNIFSVLRKRFQNWGSRSIWDCEGFSVDLKRNIMLWKRAGLAVLLLV